MGVGQLTTRDHYIRLAIEPHEMSRPLETRTHPKPSASVYAMGRLVVIYRHGLAVKYSNLPEIIEGGQMSSQCGRAVKNETLFGGWAIVLWM